MNTLKGNKVIYFINFSNIYKIQKKVGCSKMVLFDLHNTYCSCSDAGQKTLHSFKPGNFLIRGDGANHQTTMLCLCVFSDMHGRLGGDSKLAVGVNGCLSLCGSSETQ